MTYTFNDDGIFVGVPETKKLIIRRPEHMSRQRWADYGAKVSDALNAISADATPLDRGEAIHKAMLGDAEQSPSMKLVDILARELKVWPDKLGVAVGQCYLGHLHCEDEPENSPIIRTIEKYSMAKDWFGAVVTRAGWQAAVDALKVGEGIADAEAGNLFSLDEVKHKWEIGYTWPRVRYGCGIHPGLYIQFIGRVKRMKPEASPKEKATDTAWDGAGLPPVGIECEVHDCQHEYTKQFNGQNVRIVAHHVNLRGNSVAVFEAGDCVYHGLVSEKFRPIRTADQVAAEERENSLQEIASLIGRGTFIEDAVRILEAGYRKQP